MNAHDKGHYLGIEDLRELAVALARMTARQEAANGTFLVGGPVRIASLFSGHVVVENPDVDIPLDKTGTDLVGAEFFGSTSECDQNSIADTITDRPLEIQTITTGCPQKIDMITYHDSVFTRDRLTYLGTKPLLFADTNKVVDSTLDLGPKVDLTDPATRHLVCGFVWRSVSGLASPLGTYCGTAVRR